MIDQVFIVGNSRSGTTMMSRILNNHTSIFSFKELHFFGRLWSRSDSNLILNKDKSILLMSKLLCFQNSGIFSKTPSFVYKNEASSILEDYSSMTSIQVFKVFLAHVTHLSKSKISCVKTPGNLFYLKEILEHFPKARVINMIRDPRSVLLSQKNKWKRRRLGNVSTPFFESFRSYVNYHPYTISKLWNASLQKSDQFMSDQRVLNVYFEDLVLNAEKNISNICEFIGVESQNRMQFVPNIGSSVDYDNKKDLGLDPKKISRWKTEGLNFSEIYICQVICKKFMMKHQYKLFSLNTFPLLLSIYSLSLPIKLFFSFFLNIHRFKNIKEALRNRFDFNYKKIFSKVA